VLWRPPLWVGNRAPRAGGRDLDDANVLCRGVIRIEPPTQELVEVLGSIDVGHGDDVDLELHVDSRYTGVRLPLFHASSCFGFHIDTFPPDLPVRERRCLLPEHTQKVM
jgi:hypothetical protein